jgi:hypothetical protein
MSFPSTLHTMRTLRLDICQDFCLIDTMRETPGVLYGNEYVADSYIGFVKEVTPEECKVITTKGFVKYLDKYVFAEYNWSDYDWWEIKKYNLPEINQIIQVVETHSVGLQGTYKYVKLLNNIFEAVSLPENYYTLIQERTDCYQI